MWRRGADDVVLQISPGRGGRLILLGTQERSKDAGLAAGSARNRVKSLDSRARPRRASPLAPPTCGDGELSAANCLIGLLGYPSRRRTHIDTLDFDYSAPGREPQ